MDIKKGKRNTRRAIEGLLLKFNIRPWPINALRWHLIDKLRYDPKELKFSGFELVVGRRGAGKTQYMAYRAIKLKEKYGENIYLGSNFGVWGRDFKISHWKQFLEDYDKPVIFLIDEVQKEFQAQDYKNFPKELFDEFGEARKSNKMLLASAQFSRFVDNKFREYSDYITEVVNIFHWSRLYMATKYLNEDYDRKLATQDYAHPYSPTPQSREFYVADDFLRSIYNTYEKTVSIRNREYQPTNLYDRGEVNIKMDPALIEVIKGKK